MVERNSEIRVDQSNLSVKLVFDVFTPRPHFVIIQEQASQKLNATDKELNEIMQLVTEFLNDKAQYDNNAILSFHRGKWYQQTFKRFHAHLCVPKKAYCQEAKLMITSEACNHYWSSSKEYLNQLNEDLALSKIRYNQYRDKCISKAYACFNDPVSYLVPLTQFHTSKFALVFLASSPRIGIIAKKTNTDLRVLYHFLNNFYLSARKQLACINPLFDNFGVHLCLHVSGRKKKNCDLTERADRILYNMITPIKVARIVGYMQMDEQLYLRWLPAIFHRTWLKEFQKSPHVVLT